jgi:hypothetical protein
MSFIYEIPILKEQEQIDTMVQFMNWNLFLNECFGISLRVSLYAKLKGKVPNNAVLIIVPKGLTVEKVENFCYKNYSVNQIDPKHFDRMMIQTTRHNFIYSFKFVSRKEKITHLSRTPKQETYVLWTPNQRESGIAELPANSPDLAKLSINYLERLLLGAYLFHQH